MDGQRFMKIWQTNQIVCDMSKYYVDIVNITESYDVVEAINVDIGESLSGDVIN